MLLYNENATCHVLLQALPSHRILHNWVSFDSQDLDGVGAELSDRGEAYPDVLDEGFVLHRDVPQAFGARASEDLRPFLGVTRDADFELLGDPLAK